MRWTKFLKGSPYEEPLGSGWSLTFALLPVRTGGDAQHIRYTWLEWVWERVKTEGEQWGPDYADYTAPTYTYCNVKKNGGQARRPSPQRGGRRV